MLGSREPESALDELARGAAELAESVEHTRTMTALHLSALPPATKMEVEAALAASAARSAELMHLGWQQCNTQTTGIADLCHRMCGSEH